MKQYSNSKTLDKLNKFIDDLVITKDNYKIILNMVENYDSKLFVKIIEEISYGNLDWIDFQKTFNINLNKLEDSIENQEKIYNQILLLNQINATTNERLTNLITNYKQYDQNNKVINSAEKIEKENQFMSILNTNSNDVSENFYNKLIINKILDSSNSDFIDSMLMSVHDYVVPVDYDLIQLSKYDLDFAKENNLNIESMKKLKSLAAFASNYYD